MMTPKPTGTRERRVTWIMALVGAIATSLSSCGFMQTRDVILRGNTPRPGYGAYGYVLLGKSPSPASQPAYDAMCSEFLRVIDDARALGPREQRILTLWPLIEPASAPLTCADMIAKYDYPAAQMMLAAVDLANADGPVLVAAPKPLPATNAQSYLVLNMSGRSASNVRDGMRAWSEHVTKGPESWDDTGWKVERIRLRIAALVTWLTPDEFFRKSAPAGTAGTL